MFLTAYLIGLILCVARLSGFFLPLPVFGAKNVPAPVKIGLVVFISYTIIPILDISYIRGVSSLLQLGNFIIVEFVKGAFLGLSFTIALNCIYILGGLIDRNIGFSMVNIMNPMGTRQMPVSANLFYLVAIMVFFITNGHHQIIKIFVKSYQFSPIGVMDLKIIGVIEFVNILSKTFVMGFQLASPIIITIIIANIILGLLAKAMPGMNVFILGMPFKIFVGLFLLILISPVYIKSMAEVFIWIWENFMKMFVYL